MVSFGMMRQWGLASGWEKRGGDGDDQVGNSGRRMQKETRGGTDYGKEWCSTERARREARKLGSCE